MTSSKIDRLLVSADQLRTLPIIYTKLSEVLRSPDSTAQKISEVISEDQATAAKVLKMVNSVFYGFPKKIGNLQRAIVILGLNEIKSLVFATGVLKKFAQIALDSIIWNNPCIYQLI